MGLEREIASMIRDIDRELGWFARVSDLLEVRRARLVAVLKAVRTGGVPPIGEVTPDTSTARKGARRFPLVSVEWIATSDDGAATVRLSHDELSAEQPVAKKVDLTPESARILQTLASQPAGADGFPTWLTLERLIALLGETIRPHTVVVRIGRLQDNLTKAGLNRYWIDRDRQKGVRLLMRRVSLTSAETRLTG